MVDVTESAGQHLVLLLPDADYGVTAFVHDTAYHDGPPGIEAIEGNIFEPAALDPAMTGMDAAYYFIHLMHADGDFETCGRLATHNFVDATGSASVERSVYLGGLSEDHDQLSTHLWSRHEVEHILVLGMSVLTTPRAAVIVGAGSAGLEMAHQLAARLSIIVTP